jgi:hypothetical protein
MRFFIALLSRLPIVSLFFRKKKDKKQDGMPPETNYPLW